MLSASSPAETPQIHETPEQAADKVVMEPVTTRVYLSMCREHTPLAHWLQVVSECAFGAEGRLWVTTQEGRARVVPHGASCGDCETERPEQHFPADAEPDFQRLRPRRGAG